jgi:hypothetical protein
VRGGGEEKKPRKLVEKENREGKSINWTIYNPQVKAS